MTDKGWRERYVNNVHASSECIPEGEKDRNTSARQFCAQSRTQSQVVIKPRPQSGVSFCRELIDRDDDPGLPRRKQSTARG